MRKILLILVLLLSSVLLLTLPAAAQDAVSFGSTTIENRFPQSLQFTVSAELPDSDLTAAFLIIRPRTYIGFANPIALPATVSQTGTELTLSFRLESNGITIPNLPLRISWRILTADGNQYDSEETVVIYADTRFEWQTLQNDLVLVQWHDRPATFGQAVFDLANIAIEEQQTLFGEALQFPITIIIYNDLGEFEAWNPLAESERIGGQAFPEYGITAQIVSLFGDPQPWLLEVVPHEISHLYFSQVTYSTSITPQWLDEGLATYHEYSDNGALLDFAQDAAKNGSLIQLGQLDRRLGDVERTDLLYAQGMSVVTYLIETYGEDGFAALLAAFGDGQNTETAFTTATGKGLGAIQADWLAWMGVSAENYATPTPWPLPTPFPSPTPFVPRDFATDTPIPTATMTPTAIPSTPTATVTATSTPAPTNTPVPIAAAAFDDNPAAPSRPMTPKPRQEAQDDSITESVFPIGLAIYVIVMLAFFPAIAAVVMLFFKRAADRRRHG